MTIRPYLPTLFLPALLGLLLFAAPALAQDFEAEYMELIEGFADALPDSAAAEEQVDLADDLGERILQYRRDHRDDLKQEDLDRLKDLAREVRKFKSVARVVGQLQNAADVSIESFDAVNARLGLDPQVFQKDESGLEMVQINVGEFVSLLLRNPTKSTFIVTYQVNDPERPGGIGSASCEKYSVMSGLFNSRDRDLEGLEFTIQARDSGLNSCD